MQDCNAGEGGSYCLFDTIFMKERELIQLRTILRGRTVRAPMPTTRPQ